MTTTSPNQEGVEGTECEEVWMITGESVILFTYASFVRNPFILPHQEGIFLGWLARDYTSLRNSWAIGDDAHPHATTHGIVCSPGARGRHPGQHRAIRQPPLARQMFPGAGFQGPQDMGPSLTHLLHKPSR